MALFAMPAGAQLAQNGSTTAAVTFSNAALTATVAHTTPSLANRLMLVAVHMNIGLSTGSTVASVTYNGVAATLLQAINDGGAPNTRTELWSLAAPATGAHNVVVTLQNITAGQSVQGVVGITTYVDVDQNLTGSLGYATAGNSTTPSSTLAGTLTGDMVVDFTTARMNAAGTLTFTAIGAGQTTMYNNVTSSAPLNSNDVVTVASRETSTGVNVTMSYTLSAITRWTQAGTSLRAATTDVNITGYAEPDVLDGTPTNVNFIFTIAAHSAGANNVNFSFPLPAGYTIVSATATQGICTPAATTSCAIGALLNPGDSAIVTVTATSPASAVGSASGTATITVGTTDTNAGNNSATVTARTQSQICATPAKDGAAGTINSNRNTYYPATANAGAGATSITLGPVPAGYGATAIAIGDLMLVMQMQDAAIGSNNDDRYGSGAGTAGTATAGTGASNLNSAGRYEYVVATNAVTTLGGTLNLTGAGSGGGLLYAYTNAAAGAQGQRRFQVIRVPQYTTATLAAGAGAPAWNGAVGGVFAIDVAGTVTLGSGAGAGTVATTNGSPTVVGTGTTFTTQVHAGDTININGQGNYTVLFINGNTALTLASNATATATGRAYTVPALSVSGGGFRGGAGRQLPGGTGALTDYRTLATNLTNGMKGEGFAGAPRYLFQGTGAALDTGVDGYPNGSGGRGAPGNAGGGATDGNPPANDQNAGGAGGGNGGSGGHGGYAWSSNAPFPDSGGFGGTFDSAELTRISLGGGGGAGSSNNGTQAGSVLLGTNGINSSGAAGGGIVIIRAGMISGSGTIAANGSWALETANDGAGGAGAGGTIVVQTAFGNLNGLTAEARGGKGGSAWLTQANPVGGSERHGPGGGGGGGVIYLSSAAGSTNASGGANGLTTQDNDPFGATAGASGLVVTSATSPLAGAGASASCAVADLSVTNTDTPDPVTIGSNITYTLALTNNGPNAADQVAFSDAIPASTTYQSVSVPAGWTCITPAVGGTGSISCTSATLANGATANFNLVVQVTATTPAGYVISDTAIGSSQIPDSNSANNSATATTNTTASSFADVSVTLSVAATVVPNTNFTVTQSIRNNGGASATGIAFSETTPPNTTFQGITPPAGWTCITPAIGGTGTVSCSTPTPMASGASVSMPLTLRVNTGTANGTTVTETATVTTTASDPTSTNNTSSATTTVVGAASSDFATSVTALTNPSRSGGLVRFSTTVTNNGVASANATMAESVPANTTFFALTTPAGWTCTTPAVGATGIINCSSTASIAVGASSTFVATFKVNTGTAIGTVLTLSATTTTPTDSVAGNNTASATSTVQSTSGADVAIAISDSPDPVGQSQLLTYLITVANNGVATATGVSVSDPLPAGVTFQSVSSSAGSCSGTSTVVCSLGTLGAGAEATITLVVKPTSTGTKTNTATVSAAEADPVAGNNSATASTTVLTLSALSITKTNNGGGSALVNTPWTWTIHVANSGSDATFTNGQRIVLDNLPNSNINYGAVSIANATGITGTIAASITANDLTASANGTVTIANGGSFDLVFTATATTTATFTNPRATGLAKVDPDSLITETNKADNTATDSVVVVAPTTTTASAAAATFSSSAQPVTLSATVSSPGFTVGEGTVTFSVFNGATQIGSAVTSGTVTADAASAIYTLPANTTPGAYSIHATYNPGVHFTTSSDNAHLLTVSAANTTTTAANQTTPFSSVAHSVTLSATVSSSSPVNEGTVTFSVFNGATQIGVSVTSPAVSAGSASATFVVPANTLPGPYSIQATYNPGPDFNTSSDNSKTLTINAAATTTAAVDQTAIFSTMDQNVTLTAMVSSAFPVNSGTVTFSVFNGPTEIGTGVTSAAVSSGSASAVFVLPGNTPVGGYSIHATYNPAAGYIGSSDNSRTLSVSPAAAATSTTAASQTATFGSADQNVTLTAQVTSTSAVNEGTVTFSIFNGPTQIGSATTSAILVAGNASATWVLPANTPIGTYSIHATYNPGPDFIASSDTAATLTVNAAATSTTAANQTATFASTNQNVALTANVTSTTTVNEGTVTFDVFNGATQIGSSVTSSTVTGGSAGATFVLPAGTAPGTYAIHATYNPTANLIASADNTKTLTVSPAGTATVATNQTATFASTAQNVTLAATVTSTSVVNEGTVTFSVFNGATQIGSSVTSPAVAAGSATATYVLPANTSPGTYSIHATYNPAINFSGSADNSKTLTVNAATTAIAAANQTATFASTAQSVALSATVTSSSPVNEGTVTFAVFNGATQIGTAVTSPTVAAGAASATWTLPASTPHGTYTIQATYNPSVNFIGSADNSNTLIVNAAGTATTAANQTATFATTAQNVTLSATVSSTSPVNQGTVTFDVFNGATEIGSPVTSPTVSGGNASVTFVLPASTPAGTYSIHATYNAGADYSGSSDNTHTLTVSSSVVVADLSIAKSGPATAVAGDPAGFDYTLTVTNLGPQSSGAFTVTDVLPASLTFISGPFCSAAGQTVTCVGSSGLVAAASQAFTVHVTLSAAATGSISNTASVASSSTVDPNASNDTSNAVTTTIVNTAALSIVKTGPATAVAGAAIGFDYTLAVTNNGPSNQNGGFTVNDVLPSGLTFVAASSSPTCAAVAQSVTCSGGSLIAGASQSFVIHVLLSAAASGTLSNSATTSSGTSNVVSTTVTTSADLSIAKSGPMTASAGGSLAYAVTVTNLGPSNNSGGFSVSDTLPASLTFDPAGSDSACVAAGQNVTCTSAAGLIPAATRTFTINTTVAASTANGTNAQNSAHVTTSGTSDLNAGNDVSNIVSTTILTGPPPPTQSDLAVAITGPPTALAGNNVTYTITVTNGGPSDAQNVSLADTLPAGLTFVSQSVSSGAAFALSNAGSAIHDTIAILPAGASSTIQVIATVTGSGTIVNSASVSASTTDPVAVNNTSSTTMTVLSSGPTTPIPTLSWWMLIALAVSLLAIALIRT